MTPRTRSILPRLSLLTLAALGGCADAESLPGPASSVTPGFVAESDGEDWDDESDTEGDIDSWGGSGGWYGPDDFAPTPGADTCYGLVEGPLVLPVAPDDADQTSATQLDQSEEFRFECETQTKYSTKILTEIAVTSPDHDLLPGLVVDSGFVHDGTIAGLSLARSPATLQLELLDAGAEVYLENPTSSALEDAVDQLQGLAEETHTPLPEMPSQFTLEVFEASSFDQMLQDLGIAEQFADPLVEAGLDTPFDDAGSTRGVTAVVRLSQPEYSIRLDSEAYERNRDFFSHDLDWSDDATCEQFGGLFPPAYIDSITYGRMVLYTVTSDDFESAAELANALQESYREVSSWGAVSGEAREQYERLINDARVELFTLGSAESEANESIRTGDFRPFFRESRTAPVSPLSVRMRYLALGRPVLAVHSVTESVELCCAPRDCG